MDVNMNYSFDTTAAKVQISREKKMVSWYSRSCSRSSFYNHALNDASANYGVVRDYTSQAVLI